MQNGRNHEHVLYTSFLNTAKSGSTIKALVRAQWTPPSLKSLSIPELPVFVSPCGHIQLWCNALDDVMALHWLDHASVENNQCWQHQVFFGSQQLLGLHYFNQVGQSVTAWDSQLICNTNQASRYKKNTYKRLYVCLQYCLFMICQNVLFESQFYWINLSVSLLFLMHQYLELNNLVYLFYLYQFIHLSLII